jgi:hypothetical protein
MQADGGRRRTLRSSALPSMPMRVSGEAPQAGIISSA